MNPGSPAAPPGHRSRSIRRTLFGVLLANLAVAAAKLIYGAASGSLSILADGVHSLADSISNVVGLASMALARQPADAEHPYGHHRFEALASTAIGILILLGMLHIARGIFSPRDPVAAIGPGGFAIALATLAVNALVTYWEHRTGERLRSPILIADARHTLSDLLATSGVLVSFVAINLGYRQADRIVAAAIVLLIGWVGFGILKHGVDIFLDRSVLDPKAVEKAAETVPGVIDCHLVRSRGFEGWIAVDMHILLDGRITLEEAHRITHAVEEKLRADFPAVQDILIHTEPESAGREEHPWER